MVAAEDGPKLLIGHAAQQAVEGVDVDHGVHFGPRPVDLPVQGRLVRRSILITRSFPVEIDPTDVVNVGLEQAAAPAVPAAQYHVVRARDPSTYVTGAVVQLVGQDAAGQGNLASQLVGEVGHQNSSLANRVE